MGSNGWIHPVRERDAAPGMRERRGGWPRVARRPVRQISAFNGKNEGRGSSYRDAGRDWRDDRGVRERHHRRGAVFRRLRVVLGAVGGKRARGKCG